MEERSYGQGNGQVLLKCSWTNSVCVTQEVVINAKLQASLKPTVSESLGLRPKLVF